MPTNNQITLRLFSLATAMNLTAEILHHQLLIYISKPLLMIFLGWYFWRNRTPNRFTNLILAGLFFAFLGDVLLMFRTGAEGQTHFFLLGLASFLLTQLCYTIAFWGYSEQRGLVQQQPLIAIPFLLYLVGNTWILWGDLPSAFRLPVLAYSSVITLMAISCCNLFETIPLKTFQLLMLGVLLFVLSDTLIGLSSFKMKIPYSGLLIMSTYIAAQYLIVRGSLAVEEAHVSDTLKVSDT